MKKITSFLKYVSASTLGVSGLTFAYILTTNRENLEKRLRNSLPDHDLFQNLDLRSIYSDKSTLSLTRSLFVLNSCRLPWFIDIADLFQHVLPNFLVKHSFYAQFCGAETIQEMIPLMENLSSKGIDTVVQIATENHQDDVYNTITDVIKSICDTGSGSVAIKLSALCGTDELYELSSWVPKLESLCQISKDNDITLMIDAEHSSNNTIYRVILMYLMGKYNTSKPVVIPTYQMYLQKAESALKYDMYVASQYKLHFAVKLVRGAYYATETGVFDKIEETHESYNNGIKRLLESPQDMTLILATHNYESVVKCLDTTRDVQFVQLYGMHDILTHALAQGGYQVAKCIPMGSVKEAIPYLIRRGRENSEVIKGCTIDRTLLWYEITCRVQEIFKRQ